MSPQCLFGPDPTAMREGGPGPTAVEEGDNSKGDSLLLLMLFLVLLLVLLRYSFLVLLWYSMLSWISLL